MVYAYIRVSSDKQTVKNQRFEIEQYALGRGIVIDAWVEEVISGTKKARDRKIGRLLKKMKAGDILIVSELSRLGRNLLQIMSMLNFCMDKNLKIISIKEAYELGDKLLASATCFSDYQSYEKAIRKECPKIPADLHIAEIYWQRVNDLRPTLIRRLLKTLFSFMFSR